MAARSGVGQQVQSSASGLLSAAMRSRARPRLATLPVLAPVIFAVPVVSGVVTTLANLAGTSDPYLGVSTTATNVDAQAVFLGQPLYANPDEQYAGLPLSPLSPLFPLLLGALHHGSLRSGWGIVLSTAGGSTACCCFGPKLAAWSTSSFHRLSRCFWARGSWLATEFDPRPGRKRAPWRS
jgi:hypothetical protein